MLLLIPSFLASLKVSALTDSAGSAYQSIPSPKPGLLGSGNRSAKQSFEVPVTDNFLESYSKCTGGLV